MKSNNLVKNMEPDKSAGQPVNLLEIDLNSIGIAAFHRLIEEIQQEDRGDIPRAYDRVHCRHNR